MILETEDARSLDLELYGGRDPRHRPRYTFPEAARATKIPASTLRSWFVGQGREDDSRLSFTNLIEAHVLRALREVHAVKLGYIREAVEVAEKECGVSRLLISPDLRTSAGQLFLDRYTDLLELTKAQQIGMRSVLDQFLARVEFDEEKLPRELFPFERLPRNAGRRVISLSPFVSFGRAIIQSAGVTTRAVVERIEAGEAADAVREDYGLREDELEEAILYELAG